MSIKRGMIYPDNSMHEVEIMNVYLTTDDEVIVRYFDNTINHEMFTLLKEEAGKFLKNPYHKKLNEYKIKDELSLKEFESQLFPEPIIECYVKGKTNNKEEVKKQELYVIRKNTSSFGETDFVVFESEESTDEKIVKFARKTIHNRMIYEAIKKGNTLSSEDNYKLNFLGTTTMSDGSETSINYEVSCIKCLDDNKFNDSYSLENDKSIYVINPIPDPTEDKATLFYKGYNGELAMRINSKSYEMNKMTEESHKTIK